VLWVQVAKVAATLNWQMVCGCVAPANLFTYDPIEYNQTYMQGWNNVKQYAMPYAPAFRVSGWCHFPQNCLASGAT
jgi:hypothetical protein